MNQVKPSRSARWRAWLLPALLAVVIAVIAAYWLPGSRATPEGNLSHSNIGHEFNLIDANGNPVTNDSFAGKWRLMYFGYTFCPDVCPVDTATMAAALAQLRADNPRAAEKLQPLFVTVDPERDTPEMLTQFTGRFDPEILGLTGSQAQVAAALKTFRIYAEKVPGNSADDYTYDHQAMFYLMAPDGRPVQFLTAPGNTPQQLAAILERFLA